LSGVYLFLGGFVVGFVAAALILTIAYTATKGTTDDHR